MKKSRIRSKKFIIISLLCILAMFIQNVSAYADEDEVVASEESDEEATNDETSEDDGSEASGETNEDISSNSDSEEYEESTDESSSGSEEGEVISEILPTEEISTDVVSVDLPTLNDEGDSPFDYIVDPQFLIYQTDAAAYGGGSVEEGKALLFRNKEGDYDFSSQSDRLTIRNRSNVPVDVTITAMVENLNGVHLCENPDFEESSECFMYLTVTDNEGNEWVINKEGTEIAFKLDKAPENAYTYYYDEDNGTYVVNPSEEYEQAEFDTFTFGLSGECNTDGEWYNLDSLPIIRITWAIEPELSENVSKSEETEIQKREVMENNEESITDDDTEEILDNENQDDSEEANENKNDEAEDTDGSGDNDSSIKENGESDINTVNDGQNSDNEQDNMNSSGEENATENNDSDENAEESSNA